MVNKRTVSFLLSIFLIAILLSAQVAAGILVIGATEVADPVDYADTITFTVDVLESGGEITTSVEVLLDTYSSPVSLSFNGTNWTGTLAASLPGYGLHPYTVTATGDALGSDTETSDVTVGDLVDPVINAFDVNSVVCYGENI